MLLITCGEVIMKDEGDRDDLDQDPNSFKAQPYWVQWLVLVSAIVDSCGLRRRMINHRRHAAPGDFIPKIRGQA